MSDQSIVPVTQADVVAAKACWNALADADNDWDALSVDEQVAISESFARHRIAEREACAAMLEQAISEGYPAPVNKVDTCGHGKFGWEDCICCYDDRLMKVAAAIRARS